MAEPGRKKETLVEWAANYVTLTHTDTYDLHTQLLQLPKPDIHEEFEEEEKFIRHTNICYVINSARDLTKSNYIG